MYLYAMGIDFVSFYDFDISFWNYSDSIVFFVFYFYHIMIKLSEEFIVDSWSIPINLIKIRLKTKFYGDTLKSNKIHSPKWNIKIVERDKIDTHSIQIHDRSLSWLGIYTLQYMTVHFPGLVYTLQYMTAHFPGLVYTLQYMIAHFPGLVYTLQYNHVLKCIYQVRKVSGHVLKCIYQARKVSGHVLKCIYQARKVSGHVLKCNQNRRKRQNRYP
jgi:hypothetical protein